MPIRQRRARASWDATHAKLSATINSPVTPAAGFSNQSTSAPGRLAKNLATSAIHAAAHPVTCVAPCSNNRTGTAITANDAAGSPAKAASATSPKPPTVTMDETPPVNRFAGRE